MIPERLLEIQRIDVEGACATRQVAVGGLDGLALDEDAVIGAEVKVRVQEEARQDEGVVVTDVGGQAELEVVPVLIARP